MSSEDLFEDVDDPNVVAVGAGTPVELSGVSGGALDVSSQQMPAYDATSGLYTCSECPKTLKTLGGMRRHIMLHRLNEFSQRKPLFDKLQTVLFPCMVEVLEELSNNSGKHKQGLTKKMVTDILISEVESPNFSVFLESVSSLLLDLLLDRSKVMPRDQVERSLTRLYSLLSNEEVFDDLLDKFLLILPQEPSDISSHIVNSLLYRLVTKFFEKLQAYVLKSMKRLVEEGPSFKEMSDVEKTAFFKRCGSMLRALLKSGKDSTNVTYIKRCDLLCIRFVCKSSGEPISHADFFNVSMWDTDEDPILLTSHASNLFCGLEIIVQREIKKGKVTPDEVWNNLAKPENLNVLESVYFLTCGFFNEEDALSLLFDIVKCFTHVSSSLEAEKYVKERDSQGNVSAVALRTNLKRNPTTQKK